MAQLLHVVTSAYKRLWVQGLAIDCPYTYAQRFSPAKIPTTVTLQRACYSFSSRYLTSEVEIRKLSLSIESWSIEHINSLFLICIFGKPCHTDSTAEYSRLWAINDGYENCSSLSFLVFALFFLLYLLFLHWWTSYLMHLYLSWYFHGGPFRSAYRSACACSAWVSQKPHMLDPSERIILRRDWEHLQFINHQNIVIWLYLAKRRPDSRLISFNHQDPQLVAAIVYILVYISLFQGR